jgi:hypothetical protein
MNKIRNVMFATPSYDGRVDARFADSVVNTVKLGLTCGINFTPIYMAHDALVQRARNDLAKIAATEDFECMIWADSDLQWDPQWAIDLVNYEEDIVAGVYRKKTDNEELYPVLTKSLEVNEKGLIKVEGVGTGFVKVSKRASVDIYNASKPYKNSGGKDAHMVFNVEIIDGEFNSEDIVYFKNLTKLGYDIWVDPRMTLSHVGTKVFEGNFQDYLSRVRLKASDNVTKLKYG